MLALAFIAFGVSGGQVPGLHFSDSSGPAVRSVRPLGVTLLARANDGLPEGSELAYLALDPAGNLVVSDTGRKSVLRFDSTGHLLTEWGPRFSVATLDDPAGVAASADTIYLVDRGRPRIFHLDLSGRLKAIMSLEPFGTYGLNGLALDVAGNLYVADTGRNRILVFSPTGALLKTIGRSGNDLGGLTQPMTHTFGPDGRLFVADWENSRIAVWSPTLEPTAFFLTGFRPFGVAIDGVGRVFVPDTARRTVLAYTPHGTSLGDLSAPGSGRARLEVAPRQVAIRDSEPSVYVLGVDGLLRIDFEDAGPAMQPAAESDGLSIATLVLMVGLVVAAVGSRRARRRQASLLRSPLDRPVGLDAKNSAERHDQQPRADQHFLITHQAKAKQQPAQQHDQSKKQSDAH